MSAILLISGSPSATSRSAAVLEYAREQLAAAKLDVTIVSIRDFPAEDLILGRYDSPAFDAFKRLVADADGLIVSTPIYKAAYSGGLKTLLDILPTSALKGKIVLPIATGGSPLHALAIDYALKPVLSALGSTDLLQGVYILEKQLRVLSGGELEFTDSELKSRLIDAVTELATDVKRATVAV